MPRNLPLNLIELLTYELVLLVIVDNTNSSNNPDIKHILQNELPSVEKSYRNPNQGRQNVYLNQTLS